MKRILGCAATLVLVGACNTPPGNSPASGDRILSKEAVDVSKVSQVRYEVKSIGDWKSPRYRHLGRLTIMNPRDVAAWYVLPSRGSPPFPSDSKLKDSDGDGVVSARKYGGESGSVTEVELFGIKGYRVFRLPPRSRVIVENFFIGADTKLDRLDVMGALELLVNGTTPLEQWLPFDPTSDSGAKAQANGSATTRMDGQSATKPTAKFVTVKSSWEWVVKFEK